MVQRPRRPPPPRHDARPAPQPGHTREASEVIQGLRAGLAVLARRPGDVLRVMVSRDARSEVGELLRACTSRRIPCQEARDAELDRLAEGSHHEGVCVVAKERRWTPAAELADALVRGRGMAIALDRVRNPYNVGAILRSAAFFGVDAALLGTPAPHPGLAPTAVRVAEGGAEQVLLARTTDLADTLARLRARGVRVIGADGAAATGALGYAFGRPALLVMGNEREGLGERVRAQCDAIVAIRGKGSVESLNVAVAAGVLVAEMTRVEPGALGGHRA